MANRKQGTRKVETVQTVDTYLGSYTRRMVADDIRTQSNLHNAHRKVKHKQGGAGFHKASNSPTKTTFGGIYKECAKACSKVNTKRKRVAKVAAKRKARRAVTVAPKRVQPGATLQLMVKRSNGF